MENPFPVNKKDKSLLFAIPAVLIWATVATAFKLALREMHYSQLILIASGVSALFLFSYIVLAGQFNQLKKTTASDLFQSALLGFLNPFAYYLILFKAYSLLPAQLAQPLNMVWPITLAIFSVPLLKQKITWKQFAALGICFAGITVLASQGGLSGFKNTNFTGVVLALGSSVFWALFWILSVKDHRPEAVKLFLNFLFGFIYLIITVPIISDFSFPGGTPLFAAVYVGLFEAGITFLLWMKAMQMTRNTAVTGSLIYVAPFLSLILISTLLKEKIHLTTIAGLIMIVTGIIYMQKLKTL